MAFWSDFGRGVSSHITAIEFIAKHRLWLYFLYPVVLVGVLYLAGFISIYSLGDFLVNKGFDYLIGETDTGIVWLDKVLNILIWILKFAAGFIFKIYMFSYVLKIMKYIVLICCSPMMALLSERVDELSTGRKYPFILSQFLRDVFRSIAVNMRNLRLESLIAIGLLFIGWIPVIGLITIPAAALFGWYFFGFNMMDYSYERWKWKISQAASFTRKNKGIAIGNGMIFSWLILVPYIGLIIAPVLGPVAATLAVLGKTEKN
jgi:CysZ protein